MNKYIGVDLGGTHLRVALVDTDTGEIRGTKVIPTESREGHAAVIARMSGLIQEVIHSSGTSNEEIGGIGIGAPGRLDIESGIVLFLTNLSGHWPDIPLRQEMEQSLGLPTYLLNDVRAITLAEWTFGAGRGVDTMACLAIGTGIGGGLIINGKLHLGISGAAGELGHMIVEKDGPLCGCGSRGCLETFASGLAIAAMGVQAVSQGLDTHIGEMAGYDLNRVTPQVIHQAALAGDRVARDIFERAGMYIGIAVANLLVAVAPLIVVIGGGVAQVGALLLEPIRRTVKERVLIIPIEQVAIVPAQLGISAGLVGAALWAKQRQQEIG